ncbi:hypothetical protein [Streptomyces adustus]
MAGTTQDVLTGPEAPVQTGNALRSASSLCSARAALWAIRALLICNTPVSTPPSKVPTTAMTLDHIAKSSSDSGSEAAVRQPHPRYRHPACVPEYDTETDGVG